MAGAQGLAMPEEATLVLDENAGLSSTRIPVAGFDGETVPAIRAEGMLIRQVWQAPLQGRTTLQMLAPLRDQLRAAGYQVIHECAARECGGFDFRFATDTLPEPEMHVDLGDFRFLSARRLADGQPEYATLMVSRSATRMFVQLTRLAPQKTGPAVEAPQAGPAPGPDVDTALIAALERDGRAVLGDLVFATGAAQLDTGPFESLNVLAAYLRADPARAIVLVGHTDAEGGLDSNIALSRQRAAAVRNYLVEALGVPAAQVMAEGVGFLAPLASNLTKSGRQANRRVEAVLLGAR
ncbi:hypothetical protein CKO19_04445 [Rhodovulum adriaticum]|nr:hypothetical protein [Rhodovulum adriaticum]